MTGPGIHREVLDNLEDGVLVVGTGGRIETLNPAAERILGLEAGEAAGRGFAELFILREGFDDFTQLIIDATTAGTGGERRVAVRVEGDGEARSLSVATSWLRRPGADGSSEAVAAIAVFSDITELRELRETELRLAKETEAQHRRLQDAYREIEDRNAALASALRKVRIVQGLGVVLAATARSPAAAEDRAALDIGVLHEGSAVVLSLRGRLDGSNAPALIARMSGALEDGVGDLVLDCAGMSYISSAGLRVLLVGAKTCRQEGGRFALAALAPQCRSVLEMSGFLSVVEHHETRGAALAALGRSESA